MKKMRETLPHILRAGGIYLLVFGVAVFALFLFLGQENEPTEIPVTEVRPDEPIATVPAETDAPDEPEKERVTSVVGVFLPESFPREFYPVEDSSAGPLYPLELEFYLPEFFSYSQRTVTRLTEMPGEGDSQSYAVLGWVTENRAAVEPYMEYLLVDDGEHVLLCDSDGVPRFRYATGEYEPAYERDKDGDPLFIHQIDEAHVVYYTAVEAGFTESDYDPAADGRGLRFDYPESFGKVSGYPQITWSESDRGAIFAVNEAGEQLFDPHVAYYNDHGRYVDRYYLPPLTDGRESIGFYYFDRGYTRVRRQIIDHYNYFGLGQIKVVSDCDVLVNASGEEFPLPMGYSLAGYSEGMLLLEKDGRYGFVDLTGGWIAQPIFADATPFIGGFATLTTPDGRVGMIDCQGNIVLPFGYKWIGVSSGGIITAYSETYGWEVFRVNNNVR